MQLLEEAKEVVMPCTATKSVPHTMMMMMNDGSTPNASLTENGMTPTGSNANGGTTSLQDSPYLQAATFEPTAQELVELKFHRSSIVE